MSSSIGGTRIQAWSDNVTNKACNTGGPEDPTVNLDPVPAPKPVGAGPDANTATVLFNAMVYPYVSICVCACVHICACIHARERVVCRQIATMRYAYFQHNAVLCRISHAQTIGPMALKGITWFQGESNGGEAAVRRIRECSEFFCDDQCTGPYAFALAAARPCRFTRAPSPR